MMAYSRDREWSDAYMPIIRRLVGPHLLVESSYEVDTQQAADLIVMRARDMMVAARVRRPGYADRYPYEFTVRSRRDSGSKTEMAKLVDGWGDWMFYGHAAQQGIGIDRWMLIDLHAWRAALLRRGYSSNWAGLAKQQSNGDGTYFLAFDVRHFPKNVLVASSHEIQSLAA